jgi:2-oxoglutarate ferredoxin oxidoreductase subunit delta
MANKLTFKTDNCKGCGLCVDVCPKQVLALAEEQINKKGHHPVVAVNESACIGCAFCATMCPDCIIKVEKGV